METRRMDEIRGMVLPIPTLFLDDGRVDQRLLCDLTEFYIASGVHAFFILGSYGQGPALSVEERKKVAEVIVKQTRHRIPCVVHIGSVDPYTAIDLGKHAVSLGVEAVGHVGPYYYSDRSEHEVIEHFCLVDRSVGLPILVYNNPNYSGYNIPPGMMARLVRAVPNVFGAKLAMGSIDEAMAYLKIVSAHFSTFALASHLVPGMAMGIRGTISPPLTVAPEVGVKLIQTIDDGRWDEAMELQKIVIRIHDLFLRLSASFGRTVYREGLRLRGFEVKMYPRWPSRPLSEEAQAELEALFSALGLIEKRVQAGRV